MIKGDVTQTSIRPSSLIWCYGNNYTWMYLKEIFHDLHWCSLGVLTKLNIRLTIHANSTASGTWWRFKVGTPIHIKETADRLTGVGNIVVAMSTPCYMLILFPVATVTWHLMGKVLERWIEGLNNKKVSC